MTNPATVNRRRLGRRNYNHGFLSYVLNSSYNKAVSVFLVTLALPILLAYFGSYGVTVNVLEDLYTSYDRFNGSIAFENLMRLAIIGPRVLGSKQNEEIVIKYIVDMIENIQAKLPENHSNYLQYVVQNASGCFKTGYEYRGKALCYSNIQNVIAMVKPVNISSNESILISCHFDSAVSSPGVGNDLLNCVSMIEIMKNILYRSDPIVRNVIFLFSGAKEDGSMGSHAFITQHVWAKSIIAFVNLDSFGSGGRLILFQTGPDVLNLVRIYGSAVHDAHASVFAEEIITNGLISVDTDFKMFCTHGHLKGLDIARYKNGYLYNTVYDSLDAVNLDTVQHTGDNLLALVDAFIYSTDIGDGSVIFHSKPVYYDIFGYMFCYSETTAYVVQYIMVSASFYSILHNFATLRPIAISGSHWCSHLLASCAIVALSIISAFFFSILIALAVRHFGVTMLWYNTQHMIVVTYLIPTMIILWIPMLAYGRGLCKIIGLMRDVKKFMNIILLYSTMFLFMGTLLEVRSSYILAVCLAPVVLINFIFARIHDFKDKVAQWVLLNVMGYTLSATFVSYLLYQFCDFFIPLMGRIGPVVNPDLVIGIGTSVLAILMFGYFVPLLIFIPKRIYIYCIMVPMILVVVATIFFKLNSIPFSKYMPQRFIALHCESHLLDANMKENIEYSYMFYPMDYRGGDTLETYVAHLRWFHKVGHNCRGLYCHVPIIKPHFISYIDRVYRLKVQDKPEIVGKPTLHYTRNRKRIELFDIVEISITSTGSDCTEIALVLSKDVKLFNWSLFDDKPFQLLPWNGSEVYYLTHYQGSNVKMEWNFSVSLQVTKHFNGTLFRLAKTSHYRYDADLNIDFAKFLKQFPDWTSVVRWNAVYEELKIET